MQKSEKSLYVYPPVFRRKIFSRPPDGVRRRIMAEQKKVQGNRDAKAPGFLVISIKDNLNHDWGTLTVAKKEFATGSVGFYASDKKCNPENPESRYQIAITATLIGSKPKS
jgi:hypothetical protein